MSLLFSNEILDSVKKELRGAVSSVQIITAYCKQSSLALLNGCINDEVTEKKLLVRFRMDDILKESTDFSILEYAIGAGWEVFVRFDLHAKTYIVDNKRGLVGSANTTSSGFSIGNKGNMEMATLVDIEPKDVEKVKKLFDDAISIDDEILHKMKAQLETAKLDGIKKDNYSWDTSITTMFNPHIETLFSYELPEEFTLMSGEYFSFLDETYEDNVEKFKEIFRWSNAYLWLLNVLKLNDGCMYFGELSQKLHNALVSDPKPYRKDVKKNLSNLLSLIEQLSMEEIVIDRPNYSQRIRIVNYKL